MLERLHRLAGLETLSEEVWQQWEDWFVDVGESHTSLPALSFFRSPDPQRSWVTAAGAVLDAAALYAPYAPWSSDRGALRRPSLLRGLIGR